MKITERLEFMTQIHRSWDATEQRAALRTCPRRYLSYDYIGSKTWQSQYLRALAYSQQTQSLQFPIWHGAFSSISQIYKDDSFLQLSVDRLWMYRGCSALMLWLSDGAGGSLYPLKSIASNGIAGLGKYLENDWGAGTIIIAPVAWGVLQQEDKYTNVHSLLTSMTLNVELRSDNQAPDFPVSLDEYHDEPESIIWGSNVPKIYNGAEVFMKPPSWTNDITSSFQRNAARLDNNTGAFIYDLRSVEPIESREIEYVTTTQTETNNLQRFFCRCKGRLKSFWAPTWLSDIELAEDAINGQNYLLTKWPNYWKYYNAGQRRKKIIVFAKNGRARLLDIAGYSTDISGDHGKIFLSDPLKEPLLMDSTIMISFLCRYRFDMDVMTTDFDTGDVATSTLSFMEVSE